MSTDTIEVRPATLLEVLETLAEAFDLRAHTIAENYDDIDDWESKMELAESRAACVRKAASRIDDLSVSLKHAIDIIEKHVPRDALGMNAQGDPDVPGGFQQWPLLDEYLHSMRAALGDDFQNVHSEKGST